MVIIQPPDFPMPYRAWHPNDSNSLHCQHLCDKYAEKLRKQAEEQLQSGESHPLPNANFNPDKTARESLL